MDSANGNREGYINENIQQGGRETGFQLQVVATVADVNRLRIPEQCNHIFNTGLEDLYLKRIAQYINTEEKLTYFALELGKEKWEVDSYIDKYRHSVEFGSFNFLVNWKQGLTSSNEANWRRIIYALCLARVFPSPQNLIDFFATLID